MLGLSSTKGQSQDRRRRQRLPLPPLASRLAPSPPSSAHRPATLHTSGINGNNIELDYDPESGMSAEEHKWLCSLVEKIRQRVPEALHKLQAEADKVRVHFHDDPVALKVWDEYINGIYRVAPRNLTYYLSSYAQKSALYEQLMRTKARSNTSVSIFSGGYAAAVLSRGYDKLKRATRNNMAPMAAVVGVGVAAFVAGVCWAERRKEQEGKKN